MLAYGAARAVFGPVKATETLLPRVVPLPAHLRDRERQ